MDLKQFYSSISNGLPIDYSYICIVRRAIMQNLRPEVDADYQLIVELAIPYAPIYGTYSDYTGLTPALSELFIAPQDDELVYLWKIKPEYSKRPERLARFFMDLVANTLRRHDVNDFGRF